MVFSKPHAPTASEIAAATAQADGKLIVGLDMANGVTSECVA